MALLFSGLIASCDTTDRYNATPPNADLLSLGVDSHSSIESRIGEVQTEIVKRFADFRLGTLTNHVLTDNERKKFSAALAALTPLQRRVLREHLRSVSFVDGMSNNAQTSRVNPGAPYPIFDFVIRAGLFNETVSEFATRKEQQLFETGGSSLSVAIEGGSMDAMVFVLLHESTHIVDQALHLTPSTAPGVPIPEASQTPFTRGVWESAMMPVAAYRSPLLDGIAWQIGGKPMRIERAQALYDDLKQTPFVSVYASTVSVEDLPELVAWRQLTQKLGQPYRIEIRDGARVIYSYQPMASPLVRSRLRELDRFELV